MALGLVMLLWCLSGFVMMYKPYPELDEAQQLATLEPLDLQQCCTALSLPSSNQSYSELSLQMLGSTPVLHLPASGNAYKINLQDGATIGVIDEQRAMELATRFSMRRELGSFKLLGQIHYDQWTVYGANNRHRPLYKFQADDPARTQWYISSATGEVIQHTTANERLWGYLGAVIHWLYPTLLRQNVPLWSQTVIWLTIAGIFLTSTGLYFGFKQYKTRRSGRRSPYRGLSAWHHYAGLFFGFLTLGWIASGLFSMNPWGLLAGEGAGMEQAQLRGSNLNSVEITGLLARLHDARLPAGTVRLEAHKVLGDPMLFAVDRKAKRTRLALDNLHPQPLPAVTLSRFAATLFQDTPFRAELLETEDHYYYSHHDNQLKLPVWRLMTEDGSGSRYYINPDNGRLIRKVDSARRMNRWLYNALHRGDFSALARSRPLWDLMMWTLLLGVTATCGTGFLMGMRRLGASRRSRRPLD